MPDYGFVKAVATSFDDTVANVTAELQKEGFGILTTIDMKAKLKEKIGVDIDRYVILGACNPPGAYEALLAEWNIGLMLPCNVLVYEKDGDNFVAIIRPNAAMGMIDNDKLKAVAESVEEKLKRVFEAM